MTVRFAAVLTCLAGLALCSGCASYRYSIRPGLDAPIVAPTNVCCVEWRIKENGGLLRLNASMRQAVESEMAKYPSVFGPTGTPVTVILAPHDIHTDSAGLATNVDNRPNILSAFAFVFSAFTLPLCGAEDTAMQILITRQKTKAVRLSGPLVLSQDYVERRESRISLFSPLGLFCPYFDPGDTPYFRTAHEIPPEGDPVDSNLKWAFVVRRVAERLAEAEGLTETMPEVKSPENETTPSPESVQVIEMDEIPL